MPQRNPTNPAGRRVAPGHSQPPQQQPSRFPGEQSRARQSQHTACYQTQYPHGQVETIRTQDQSDFLCPNIVTIQPRQHQTQYPHSQVQPTRAQNQPRLSPIIITREPSQHHQPTHHTNPHTQAVQYQPSQQHQPNPYKSHPNPGPPDGFITENGRQLPVWYNPPGIVDKDMSPNAQAEYDRVRRQIINGRR